MQRAASETRNHAQHLFSWKMTCRQLCLLKELKQCTILISADCDMFAAVGWGEGDEIALNFVVWNMTCFRQLDRLKELTRRDAEEQEKKLKRIEDRKVITMQIEARQRAKLIRLEAREQASTNIVARGYLRRHLVGWVW